MSWFGPLLGGAAQTQVVTVVTVTVMDSCGCTAGEATSATCTVACADLNVVDAEEDIDLLMAFAMIDACTVIQEEGALTIVTGTGARLRASPRLAPQGYRHFARVGDSRIRERLKW